MLIGIYKLYKYDKLLFYLLNRLPRAGVFINYLDYANRINSLDHNVVCINLLNYNNLGERST
jgi:hypothetical protein